MEQNNKQNQRFTKKKSKYNGEMTVDDMIDKRKNTSFTLGLTVFGVISILIGLFNLLVLSDVFDYIFSPLIGTICILGGIIIISIAINISEQEKITAALLYLAYRKQEEVDAAIYEERIEQKKQDAANALDDLMKENGDGKL